MKYRYIINRIVYEINVPSDQMAWAVMAAQAGSEKVEVLDGKEGWKSEAGLHKLFGGKKKYWEFIEENHAAINAKVKEALNVPL